MVGWVDIHFPCDGITPVRVRGVLPEPYSFRKGMEEEGFEEFRVRLRALAQMMMYIVGIPKHMHFHATFHLPDFEADFSSEQERDQYSHNATIYPSDDT
jgi:hypothetical protein